MSGNTSVPWRVGKHYAVHVYAGDVPVATFHTSLDAAAAVKAHNDALRAGVERHDSELDAYVERADHRDANPKAELDHRTRMGFQP